jgi:hypothetical protein
MARKIIIMCRSLVATWTSVNNAILTDNVDVPLTDDNGNFLTA